MINIDIAARIIHHKKIIVVFFLLLAIVCAVAQFFVSVNYNMVDYLPDHAPATIALEIMKEEFSGTIPNTRIMLKDVSIQEALHYKNKLSQVDGVYDVTWLDNVIDLKMPLEMADQDIVEEYYKDQQALFSLSIRNGEEAVITDAIYELIGEENAMTGEAVDTALSQKMALTETLFAAALLIPIIIIILILSTNSWVEPLFFLTAIGVSVLINMGTNIFIGEVSFVTQSVAPILQLAVSLDYAIFLLHSFTDYRRRNIAPAEAMQLAMKRSFPAIAASAATTFFGFTALTMMSFEIGADLGFNLVKGILLSFICVMIFLPTITLCFYKWIDKSQHKPILPKIPHKGRALLKLRIPSLIIIFLLLVPSFLGQNNTTFTYGLEQQPEETRAGRDLIAIEDSFGKSTPIVLLVPRGDLVREVELIQELSKLDYVSNVIGYANTVGSVIPAEYVDETITEQFLSNYYSRIILYSKTEKEGEIAFSLVEEVQSITSTYYEDHFYSLGESVTLFDIKNTVSQDNLMVNLLTIIAIALVLLITFRSISIPIVLLLTIQSAVWINLSVPYFMDTKLDFIGFLIVSTVQLAATVDYAILLTEHYKQHRKRMPALQAIKKTLDEKRFSIAISASILSSVGFVLWITSTNPIVSSIGLLLGRGALLAFIMVICFLPAMLYTFDKWIQKTTFRANFYKEKRL